MGDVIKIHSPVLDLFCMHELQKVKPQYIGRLFKFLCLSFLHLSNNQDLICHQFNENVDSGHKLVELEHDRISMIERAYEIWNRYVQSVLWNRLIKIG